MADVTVTVKLYVVSGSEHFSCESGLGKHSLANHKERRGCMAGLELAQDLRCPGWVGAIVEGEAQSMWHVEGMPEPAGCETGGSRAAAHD